MKKLNLLLFSVSPLLVGYFLSYMAYNHDWYGGILTIISVIFCIYWFYAGYKSYDFASSRRESIFIGNSCAFIAIILILFQGLLLGRFIMSFLGSAPQYFFFPMIRVSLWFEGIIFFFTSTTRVETISLVSFILMIAIYNVGFNFRLKNE